jgi:ABC-type lipoprotein release transport system permease subunit
MTFERLVWQGLTQGKLRLIATVLAVACACAASILSMNGVSSGGSFRYIVLSVAPVVFVSSSMAANSRRARDRVLFRFGFSHEQLATLLGLEGVLIGALGAMLGIVVSVVARLWLPSLGDGSVALTGASRFAPAELSFIFCATLVLSALAVLGPAYRLASANFESDDESR